MLFSFSAPLPPSTLPERKSLSTMVEGGGGAEKEIRKVRFDSRGDIKRPNFFQPTQWTKENVVILGLFLDYLGPWGWPLGSHMVDFECQGIDWVFGNEKVVLDPNFCGTASYLPLWAWTMGWLKKIGFFYITSGIEPHFSIRKSWLNLRGKKSGILFSFSAPPPLLPWQRVILFQR